MNKEEKELSMKAERLFLVRNSRYQTTGTQFVSIVDNGELREIDPNEIEYIQKCMHMWQKAYFLTQWFIRNTQEEEFRGYQKSNEISYEKLMELRDICYKLQDVWNNRKNRKRRQELFHEYFGQFDSLDTYEDYKYIYEQPDIDGALVGKDIIEAVEVLDTIKKEHKEGTTYFYAYQD